MEEISNSKSTVKKSKFFAHLFSIESDKELKEVANFMKNEYNKSAHVCYGGIINREEIFKNDSEVGSPGKVLLGILKNNKMDNHVLIVARNYGGIKLGPAGVLRAFKEVGQECF